MAKIKDSRLNGYIRESRAAKYSKSKDFFDKYKDQLKVSYSHYAAVENGTKYPDINLVVAISKALELDLRVSCHLWSKDQMPSSETKAFFEPMPGLERLGVPATAQIPNLDDIFVFTSKQLPYLLEHPDAWDVLLYINAEGEKFLDEKLISKNLKISLSEVKHIVEWLRNESLVRSQGGFLITNQSYYHLPNTHDFKELRDKNFLMRANTIVKNVSSVSLAQKECYRTTFGRKLSLSQAKLVSSHIDDLVATVGDLEEEGGQYHVMLVGLAPRIEEFKS